jgi:hypothetical protein
VASVPVEQAFINFMVILMSKHKLWYGFLEAGEKSSPVAIDRNMETGDKKTVYIYNHKKQEILKYVRELAEPKLRELTAEEKQLEGSLKKGFTESLDTIKFKVPKALNIPDKAIPSPKNEKISETADLEIKGLDDDDDDDAYDDLDDSND